MTKIVGLTGGIGSGKSTVAKYIASLGIPVYIADEKAKEVLEETKVINELVSAFGEDVLTAGKPDRKKIADIVFNDAEKLKLLNSIIHPAVKADFNKWIGRHQNEDIVVKEAAILFESGSYKDVDAIILVTAPENIRIERVMKRDNVAKENVLARIKNQWPEERKAALSDFTVNNLNISTTHKEIDDILKKLRNF